MAARVKHGRGTHGKLTADLVPFQRREMRWELDGLAPIQGRGGPGLQWNCRCCFNSGAGNAFRELNDLAFRSEPDGSAVRKPWLVRWKLDTGPRFTARPRSWAQLTFRPLLPQGTSCRVYAWLWKGGEVTPKQRDISGIL